MVLCILNTLPKGPKLNITEHYKQSSSNILNVQLHYTDNSLFDTNTNASHTSTNISAIKTFYEPDS